MPCYEFICPAGHLTEDILPVASSKTLPCSICGEPSKRIPSLTGYGRVEGGTPVHYGRPHEVMQRLCDEGEDIAVKNPIAGKALPDEWTVHSPDGDRPIGR